MDSGNDSSLRTTVQSDQKQTELKKYQEACEKEQKQRTNILLVLFYLFIIVFLFHVRLIRQGGYSAFLVLILFCLACDFLWRLRNWANNPEPDVLKKFQQRWLQLANERIPQKMNVEKQEPIFDEKKVEMLERKVFSITKSIKLTRQDDGINDLSSQLPLVCTLVRMMPGSDRPDYWLAKCTKPIQCGEKSFEYIIMGLRLVGDVITTERESAFNITYVTDLTLFFDRVLDFEKCGYGDICFGIAVGDKE